MKAWLVGHALQLVMGPLVGVIVFALHEQLQKAILWFGTQPAWVKRGASVALVSLVSVVANALGVSVPDACVAASPDVATCLAGLAEQGWLTAAVGAAAAEITHRIVKRK